MPRPGSRAAVVLLAAASTAAILATFGEGLSDVVDRRFVETAKALIAAALWQHLVKAQATAARNGRGGSKHQLCL